MQLPSFEEFSEAVYLSYMKEWWYYQVESELALAGQYFRSEEAQEELKTGYTRGIEHIKNGEETVGKL